MQPSFKALLGALQSDKSDAVREAAATVIGEKFTEKAKDYVLVLAEALKLGSACGHAHRRRRGACVVWGRTLSPRSSGCFRRPRILRKRRWSASPRFMC